jgi:hypothetical protein
MADDVRGAASCVGVTLHTVELRQLRRAVLQAVGAVFAVQAAALALIGRHTVDP